MAPVTIAAANDVPNRSSSGSPGRLMTPRGSFAVPPFAAWVLVTEDDKGTL